MLFSSPVFLFLFLPALLGLHFVCPIRFQNLLLLAASLLFYAWGEPRLIVVMLGSIVMNFVFGLVIERSHGSARAPWMLAMAITANLGLLAYFKYSGFLVQNLNLLLSSLGRGAIPWREALLPLGISFYTFQAVSYVIDVYRREVPAERKLLNLALYKSLFPQLIAGPIVRYVDVAEQVHHRRTTLAGLASGIERFILGLGKKMLIANAVGSAADAAFEIPSNQLAADVAWLGIVCYTLQIYFDFSGYSDMAIGLGRMLGFDFLENFDYPYISKSITEFWRRWHISLSSWYRDYLYIPLGGSRCRPLRVYFNLLTVFLLCGLWHGASWNFVVWGLYYGLFLVAERGPLGHWLNHFPRPIRHVYVLVVVLVGWVFFRARDLSHAMDYLRAMLGHNGVSDTSCSPAMYLDSGLVLALVAGIVGSAPAARVLANRASRFLETNPQATFGIFGWELGRLAVLGVVLTASSSVMLASTYNPFIYFRF